ncbi:hypothetical protein pgond44_06165 [Psychroflexus gondwanensis ACAM 44]|jgi:hypothetical protein|uniref:Lipoprotein n=3 Tax=Psychroflexus gondwanensis TaxID=251 RepID=N1WWB4_9FLAO|nr:hypothetical protein [Psychroflexus gondwanensis]EMY81414.1 hypothetical protein pgond44_06165 [Psychroflexus gondwanensis ACAM 44]
MKKVSVYLGIIFLLFCYSCASEDEDILLSDSNYFPLALDNSWTYENTSRENSSTITGNETLSISEVNTQNPQRFSFTQTVTNFSGVFTTILSSGEVYKQNGEQTIIFDGEYSVFLSDEFPGFTIPLLDVTLYDAALTQGDVLYTSLGEVEEDINGFPVSLEYEITLAHAGFMENMTVNGQTYSDVYSSKISLNLSASVFIVFSDFTILQEQNASTITNYYAKDIGLIKSDVSTDIIFEDIPEQLNFEIPDVSVQSNQNLIDSSINLNF